MAQIERPDWLTPSASARALGISVSRVRQLAAEGRLRYTATPLGRLIDQSSLEDERQRRAARCAEREAAHVAE
jgi:hypothetical protein